MKKRAAILGVSIFFLIAAVSGAWGDIATEKLVADFGWRGLFIGIFYNVLLPPIIAFHNDLPLQIALNPAIENPSIYTPLTFFIKILEPVYIILLILCGFYIILMSSSPKGRANAKSLLPRLFISMILVTLSPYVLKFLFNASQTLSEDILAFNPANINVFRETIILLTNEFATKTAISFEGGHLFFLIEFFLILGIFLMLALRYIILTIFAIMFPLAIFLYFFDNTKAIGRKMIEQTFLWSFSQAILALVFVTANISVDILAFKGTLLFLAGFTASVLFILTPICLFVIIRRFLP